MPVMKLASSLAKKEAAFAMSCGVATRPSGMPDSIGLRFSGVSGLFPKTSATLQKAHCQLNLELAEMLEGNCTHIAVSPTTGQMALQRILSFANSAASPFVAY